MHVGLSMTIRMYCYATSSAVSLSGHGETRERAQVATHSKQDLENSYIQAGALGVVSWTGNFSCGAPHNKMHMKTAND